MVKLHIRYDGYELLESEPEDYLVIGATVSRYSKVSHLGFELEIIKLVYFNTVKLRNCYQDGCVLTFIWGPSNEFLV